MNKRMMRAELVLFCSILLVSSAILFTERLSVAELKLRIEYGETHENRDGGTGQLFYDVSGEGFREEACVLADVSEQDVSMTFDFPEVDLQDTVFRFDPFMKKEIFSIKTVGVIYDAEYLIQMNGAEFYSILSGIENCVYDEGRYVPLSEDPILLINEGFGRTIMDVWYDRVWRESGAGVFLVILLLLGMAGLPLFSLEGARLTVRRRGWHRTGMLAAGILAGIGLASHYGIAYLIRNFGDVRAEELIFHLRAPLEGSNYSTFYLVLVNAAAIAIGGILLTNFGDWGLQRLGRGRGYPLWISALGITCTAYALWVGYHQVDFGSYLAYRNEDTSIYEDYYVDGREIALTFPKERRNLIYIFMESMETTYADKASGGAMDENYIPELTSLSLENINFSGDSETLGGAYAWTGATYTMGGLVAQTAGVPVSATMLDPNTVNDWGFEGTYLLKGAYTLGDVLAQEGYQQVFLIGSDGAFGGRAAYFSGHGNYEVLDYGWAFDEGLVDYYVWWGYEDARLFTLAKDKLLALAGGEEPFNLTMLTVDTHFTDGYLCQLCGDAYDEQYSNVLACASAQVYEFIKWVRQQDFYDNTTIIIAGDHLTMDSDYIRRNGVKDTDRSVFFTVINPAEGCVEPQTAREYSTCDFFPTTLAAMGVQIEGERLGLGVNLFSDVPTLQERFGGQYMDVELLKYSKLYAQQLLY